MKKIVVFLFIMFSKIVVAQQDSLNKPIINSITSASGNYIYMYDIELYIQDTLLIQNTDYFVIERVAYTSGDEPSKDGAKKVATLKSIQSFKELRNFYSNEYIEDFKKNYKLKNNDDLVNYFKTKAHPKDYSLYYKFIETKMALGHVFLDKDVKEGEKYVYFITRVDKNKTQKLWGKCAVDSKIGNVVLPYLKPKSTKLKQYDSTIMVEWKLPINEKTLNALELPKSAFNYLQSSDYMALPFVLDDFRAHVYELAENGKYTLVSKLLGTTNIEGDTLIFSYTRNCLPEQVINLYLQVVDEVYNEGLASDTVTAFSITQGRLAIVKSIDAKEIENGIQLSWKKLPTKPYLYGIEVGKYSNNVYDTLAILSPYDTTFIDKKLEVGVHYTYQVKAKYLPQLKLDQLVPANAVGTITKFSKPNPPSNLVATNVGKHIKLSWECNETLGFKGYYVYRGTSAQNMNVISGSLTNKTFTDTAESLSGRSEYYYAVLSQNLMQDTSIYSNVVSISPNRVIETTLPSGINFYYSNGSLSISWKDVRENDNAIEAFMVQRKKEGEADYKVLTPVPTNNNNIQDNNIVPGVKYYYRVANVNMKKQISNYSSANVFELEKDPVDVIEEFYVRNTEGNIEISLPKMEFAERNAYNIYRRSADASVFEKLATIDAKTFIYLDKTALSKTIYVYAITVTNNDGREGIKGKSISVRKD
ncbi:MAG: fibronectin type III domain-containing protein [Chitinophagaceae bacterium]